MIKTVEKMENYNFLFECEQWNVLLYIKRMNFPFYIVVFSVYILSKNIFLFIFPSVSCFMFFFFFSPYFSSFMKKNFYCKWKCGVVEIEGVMNFPLLTPHSISKFSMWYQGRTCWSDEGELSGKNSVTSCIYCLNFFTLVPKENPVNSLCVVSKWPNYWEKIELWY